MSDAKSLQFQCGAHTVKYVCGGRFRLDGGAMFGIVPRGLWSAAYPFTDESNRVALTAPVLIVTSDGFSLVVDTGPGTKLPEKKRLNFGVLEAPPRLDEVVMAAGVPPEAVTHVLLTHLHFDHAGGATALDAQGTAAPVFSKARHIVGSAQLDWARQPTMKDRASYLPENWEPLASAGLLDPAYGTGDIVPGVRTRVVHGHTRAMLLAEFDGPLDLPPPDFGTAPAQPPAGWVMAVDLVPTRAHIALPYISAYDNEPLRTLDEKARLFDELHERNFLLGLGHDAEWGLVSLAKGERGYTVAAAWRHF